MTSSLIICTHSCNLGQAEGLGQLVFILGNEGPGLCVWGAGVWLHSQGE